MRHDKRRPFALAVMLVMSSLACSMPGANRTPLSVLPPPLTPGSAQPGPAGTPTPIPPTPTPWWVPSFETSGCQFLVPSGYDPTCGSLTVPERRDVPGSRMIRLHVAVFHCLGGPACQPDPVIHLSGGPGSYGLTLVPYMFNTGAAAILQNRDYVFFDQRGVGTSDPALDCNEGEQVADCRSRLVAAGIDLNAYNSAASAADIEDLRLALGYSQVNLHGVSYGTRLALTAMRDQPQGIRSVILDSTYPPQANLYVAWAASAQRAFGQLFAACTADPACSAAHPDLEAVFFQTIDQLNASSATVDAAGASGPVPMTVDGDKFMDTVYITMYNAANIPQIPRMIVQVHNGDYRLLSGRLVVYLDHSSSLGMNYSVQCYEEIPFSTWNDVLAGTAALAHPQVAYFGARLGYLYDLCKTWVTAPPPAIENQPVASPIPTLLLAGQFDPITPPEWADLAARTLPNSSVFKFANSGHWVLRSGPCGWDVVQEFLNNPSSRPGAGCVAGLGPPVFQ